MSKNVYRLGRETISLNEIYDAVLRKNDTRFKDYDIIRANNYFLLVNKKLFQFIIFVKKINFEYFI